jgi:hypothetical protein
MKLMMIGTAEAAPPPPEKEHVFEEDLPQSHKDAAVMVCTDFERVIVKRNLVHLGSNYALLNLTKPRGFITPKKEHVFEEDLPQSHKDAAVMVCTDFERAFVETT